MCEHQAVVGGEGGGQVVPVQGAVKEPNVTLLGYNPWGQKYRLSRLCNCFYAQGCSAIQLVKTIKHEENKTLAAVSVDQAYFSISATGIQLKDPTPRIKMRYSRTVF